MVAFVAFFLLSFQFFVRNFCSHFHHFYLIFSLVPANSAPSMSRNYILLHFKFSFSDMARSHKWISVCVLLFLSLCRCVCVCVFVFRCLWGEGWQRTTFFILSSDLGKRRYYLFTISRHTLTNREWEQERDHEWSEEDLKSTLV